MPKKNSYTNVLLDLAKGVAGSDKKLEYIRTLEQKMKEVPKSKYLGYLNENADKADLTSTICVQIPAYCDVDVPNTVWSLLRNASSPDRVRIKIFLQDGSEELEHILNDIEGNIEVKRIVPEETRGLCYARYQCNLMMEDDTDFTMHIDSHMRFAKFWDVGAIQLWNDCNDEKAIVSQRPIDFSKFYEEPLESNIFIEKAWCVRMKLSHFAYGKEYLNNIAPRLIGHQASSDDAYSPITSCISGGFLFAKAEVDRKVPSDPNMYFVADEPCMAIRYWTHGYNIYSPDHIFVYHLYFRPETIEQKLGIKVDRGTKSKYISAQKASEEKRARILFGLDENKDVDFGEFGLGTERSLADYEKFCGVNFHEGIITKKSVYGHFTDEEAKEDDDEIVWCDWEKHPEKVHIGIYYIATGDYKKCFKSFIESIQNFYPEYKRTVMLITDGLSEWDGYTDDNLTVRVCPRINHYPWPVVSLYKMYHIAENYDESFTHMCYFNANTQIIKNNKPLDFNRFNATKHIYSAFKGYDVFNYVKLNEKSSAYMKNGTYDYVQACFFFGPSYLVMEMCKSVNKMLSQDMNRRMFAQWHDESYLNKWCVTMCNKQLIVRKQFCGTADVTDDNLLFHSLDKSDFGIVKK